MACWRCAPPSPCWACACPNAALPPRRCACRACWRRCRTATCRRCCWAACVLVRLLRRLRLPGRPRAAPAGAVGRTGRFHRLRLRRRLHAVGPAGRAADRTPGPAPLPLALGAAALIYLALLPAARAPRAAHRRRLGRGLAAVPEPAGAAARARPRNAARCGPEHLRHLGASLGTAVAGTLYTMPALARWPCRQRRVAVAALGLHWRLNARRARVLKAAPKPAPAPPVSRPRLPAGLFVPVGYAAVARGSVTSPRPSRSRKTE